MSYDNLEIYGRVEKSEANLREVAFKETDLSDNWYERVCIDLNVADTWCSKVD